ncbi:MAG: CTP synthase, partial [Nitriliruptorales bacterium]|nr:CTP synthase [Nitriliruptorales bacterium]
MGSQEFDQSPGPAPSPARRHADREPPTRFVFVTGGVSSALGKGITAASLGRLLKARGLKVSLQKLDPYINVDPGTMNPFEHGEVFVTDDGGETDLDLGHYERFVDENLLRTSSVSSGQIWSSVIDKERRGDYLGKTVQVVPHITNEIKDRILAVADDNDVVIIEVGGTVGDIEGLPFLEAIRQLRLDVGRERICYVHVALVPFIAASGELKTKPAQHSVREIRSIGIQPDVLVLRADRELDETLRRKVALQCDVDVDAVVAAVDSESLYAVPLAMHEEGLDRVVATRLGLPDVQPDLDEWRDMVARATEPRESVTVALVGKYVDLPDAYLSVAEALRHGGMKHGVAVDIRWVTSDDITAGSVEAILHDCDAIVVPGGFGYRGFEGKIQAVRHAREHDVPYLGLCLGLHAAVIEFARNVVGLEEANSAEFAPTTPHPVIDLMPDQRDVTDKGGTMRLGSY